jgi:hypothetical protein
VSWRLLAVACIKSGGGEKNKLWFSGFSINREIWMVRSMVAMSCGLDGPTGETNPRGISRMGPS